MLTYPFQMQQYLVSGYIARKGEWLDIIGYVQGFKICSNLVDYRGFVVHKYYIVIF